MNFWHLNLLRQPRKLIQWVCNPNQTTWNQQAPALGLLELGVIEESHLLGDTSDLFHMTWQSLPQIAYTRSLKSEERVPMT